MFSKSKYVLLNFQLNSSGTMGKFRNWHWFMSIFHHHISPFGIDFEGYRCRETPLKNKMQDKINPLL